MTNADFIPQVVAVVVLLAGLFLFLRGVYSIVIGLLVVATEPLLTRNEARADGCIILLSFICLNIVPGAIFIRIAGGFFGWFGW